MKLELRGVRKGSERNPVLAATSAIVRIGEAVLVEAETEQRPTVLGLIASGRMRPDAGEVLLDGRKAANALRKRSALVDAPDVSDHDPNVLTIGVVQEELMYAGRSSGPLAAKQWLKDRGFERLAMQPIGTVRPSVRIRILLALASERPGVDTLVLVSPDRHGGRPQDWWVVAEDFAARDFAVLVIAGRASWQVIVGPDDVPDAAADVLAAYRIAEIPSDTPASDPDSPARPSDISADLDMTPELPGQSAEILTAPAPAAVVSDADVEISAIRLTDGTPDAHTDAAPDAPTDPAPTAPTPTPDVDEAAETPSGEDAR